MKIKKVLIANRGEIAVRIIRTLREMGIVPVAVYSDEDKDALHVRLSDEAYPLGPAPSKESYLVIEKIIAAAKQSGADAIHPGYGFLSEKAAFRRACDDAGVVFIGPSAAAMDAMGYKTSAREKMIAAGVPVVPGDNAKDAAEAIEVATRVGYPVMLKAAGGGGGKGMRLVHNKAELPAAWDRASSESKNAFGDGTLYVEKAILKPRHVEIQVLADQHGNSVHLFERDCSVQRRHQKVVEESPSPSALRTPKLIASMGDVAVRAAKAVGYHSAGTVEFLLDQSGAFYFLEMNTRLQVEHPVTEMITGMDLVRQMVRVAEGETLGFTQSDVIARGHAIECRVYAEDPSQNFVPSPGVISVLRSPVGPFVRDDSGVRQGSKISEHYDPMISKLCVWAPTRSEAIQKMKASLKEYVILGISHNIPLHLGILSNETFLGGDYHTGFFEEHPVETLLENEVVSEACASLQHIAGHLERSSKQANDRAEHQHTSAWRDGSYL